jgi:hypothetical protein
MLLVSIEDVCLYHQDVNFVFKLKFIIDERHQTKLFYVIAKMYFCFIK